MLNCTKRHFLLIWSFALSALFIGICSKSSPLYPMNDWVDVNCFFTMGRSLLDGLVPYRDLYEQKGPVLYFVYAIISLFSRDSYWGVYLLEVVAFGLFLYYSGKLAQLFLGKSRIIYLLLAFLAAPIVTSWSFTHGGSVEQNTLFMLVYGMYSVLRAIKERRGLTFREALVNGIFAGILLWSKYTMLGFYLGLALFVLLWYLADPALRRKLLATIGQFFLGILAVSGIVFLYFGYHGALEDLFTTYFYNNIFLYPTETDGSRLKLIYDCVKAAIKNNRNFTWFLWIGLVWLVCQLRARWRTVVMPILCFLGLMAGTYWGGKGFDYYGLVLAAFCIYGLVGLVSFLRYVGFFRLLRQAFGNATVLAGIAISLAACILLATTWTTNPNRYLIGQSRENTVQYRFAEIIKAVDDPTLLNYGFLDGGFFYAGDATPACRFYCYFNINAPDMWENQRQCIESGDADFIVTRKYSLDKYSVDASKYQLVDVASQHFNKDLVFVYYLYQRIPQ